MADERLVSAVSPDGFWRCGRHFPHAGIVVAVDEFTDDEWARIMAEPNLRISDAKKADMEALAARDARIAEAIKSLKAHEFTAKGRPNIDVLNAILGTDLGKITGIERNRVFNALVADGFEVPKKD